MRTSHLKVAASVSLGVQLIPGGYISLEEKVTALAKAGFDGVDVYMWDLVPYTEHMFNRKLSQKNTNYSQINMK